MLRSAVSWRRRSVQRRGSVPSRGAPSPLPSSDDSGGESDSAGWSSCSTCDSDQERHRDDVRRHEQHTAAAKGLLAKQATRLAATEGDTAGADLRAAFRRARGDNNGGVDAEVADGVPVTAKGVDVAQVLRRRGPAMQAAVAYREAQRRLGHQRSLVALDARPTLDNNARFDNMAVRLPLRMHMWLVGFALLFCVRMKRGIRRKRTFREEAAARLAALEETKRREEATLIKVPGASVRSMKLHVKKQRFGMAAMLNSAVQESTARCKKARFGGRKGALRMAEHTEDSLFDRAAWRVEQQRSGKKHAALMANEVAIPDVAALPRRSDSLPPIASGAGEEPRTTDLSDYLFTDRKASRTDTAPNKGQALQGQGPNPASRVPSRPATDRVSRGSTNPPMGNGGPMSPLDAADQGIIDTNVFVLHHRWQDLPFDDPYVPTRAVYQYDTQVHGSDLYAVCDTRSRDVTVELESVKRRMAHVERRIRDGVRFVAPPAHLPSTRAPTSGAQTARTPARPAKPAPENASPHSARGAPDRTALITPNAAAVADVQHAKAQRRELQRLQEALEAQSARAGEMYVDFVLHSQMEHSGFTARSMEELTRLIRSNEVIFPMKRDRLLHAPPDTVTGSAMNTLRTATTSVKTEVERHHLGLSLDYTRRWFDTVRATVEHHVGAAFIADLGSDTSSRPSSASLDDDDEDGAPSPRRNGIDGPLVCKAQRRVLRNVAFAFNTFAPLFAARLKGPPQFQATVATIPVEQLMAVEVQFVLMRLRRAFGMSEPDVVAVVTARGVHVLLLDEAHYLATKDAIGSTAAQRVRRTAAATVRRVEATNRRFQRAFDAASKGTAKDHLAASIHEPAPPALSARGPGPKHPLQTDKRQPHSGRRPSDSLIPAVPKLPSIPAAHTQH